MGYLMRSYDHHCEICGKDISDRLSGTKYCLECAKKLNNERAAERKRYQSMLAARDTTAQPSKRFFNSSCPVCGSVLTQRGMFCSICGQRIKEGDKYEWQKLKDASNVEC